MYSFKVKKGGNADIEFREPHVKTMDQMQILKQGRGTWMYMLEEDPDREAVPVEMQDEDEVVQFQIGEMGSVRVTVENTAEEDLEFTIGKLENI